MNNATPIQRIKHLKKLDSRKFRLKRGKSALKNVTDLALQPVAELFQRIERDVLFSQFKPVEG